MFMTTITVENPKEIVGRNVLALPIGLEEPINAVVVSASRTSCVVQIDTGIRIRCGWDRIGDINQAAHDDTHIKR